MKQIFSRWLSAVLLALSLFTLNGCTGVETEPQGVEAPEEPQTEEYLKGEKSIQ